MKKKSQKKSKASWNEKIFIAGSGGQGVLFLGKVLYLTAVGSRFQATFFPSYGAEVRGGTTKCMVTVSGAKIATPLFRTPDTGIILNEQSLNKYRDILSECKRIILFQKDSKKISPLRKDQKIYSFLCLAVPCFENIRSAALYARIVRWFSKEDFLQSLTHVVKAKGPEILKKNTDVFEEAYQEFKDMA